MLTGRRVATVDEALNGQPGDYCLTTVKVNGESRPAVFGLLPTGSQFSLWVPPWHSIVEHEDGTVTVEPSIRQDFRPPVGESPGTPAWHGFLRRGVWTP